MKQMPPSKSRTPGGEATFLIALSLLAVLGCRGAAFAQSGTAGGDLSGSYPNPTLAVDRVKKSGDAITGQLSVSVPNTGNIPSPLVLASGGNPLSNRGVAMQFQVPSGIANGLGFSTLGGQVSNAWGANGQTYMSFSAYNGTAMGEVFRLDGRGFVGIGTANPTSKLHVVSGTDSGTTMLSLDTGVHGGMAFAVYGTANNESGFDLSVYRAGQYFSRLGVNSTGNVFMQPGAGSVGVGTATPSALYKLDVVGQLNASSGLCIAGVCKGSWSEVTAGGGSSQWTTAGASVYYSAGNVGVGTSAPLQKFQIGSNTAAASATPDAISLGATYSSTAGANPKLRLYDDNAGAVYGLGVSNAQFDFVAPATARFVWGLGGAERMRLDGAGNLGLGTPTPQSALDISGASGLTLRTAGTSPGFNVFDRPAAPGNQLVFQGNGGTYSVFNVTTKNAAFGTEKASALAMWTVDSANLANATQFQIQHSPSFGGVLFTQKFGTGAQGDKNISFQTAWNQVAAPTQLVLHTNGSVGIGTAAPTAAGGVKLDVGGSVNVNGDITVAGNINAKFQDVAEWVSSTQKLSVGTVVILDADRNNHVIASVSSYDTRVAGVVSERPGIALGEGGEGRVLVATTGRVRLKVDATRSAIHIGDLLVTSDVEGVAMKSVPVDLGGTRIHRPGTIIGKALEPLAGGTGEILVLLSLQ